MDRDVTVRFQPIVDLDAETVVGAETLARFADGESPEARIQEIVQDPARAADLTARVCIEALHVLQELPESCYVTINLPSVILGAGLVKERLPVDHVPPALLRRLVVEITEDPAEWDEAMPEVLRGAQHEAVEAVRAAGMRIALDDFGRRGGSIARMLQMEFDILKIDRAFVRRVYKDRHAERVLRAIVAMARSLGVETVAEGIEYKEQATIVRAVGVDYGQGYLWHRPMRRDEFVHLVCGEAAG